MQKEVQLKIIDWIAIIGALAWTPHVYSKIKSALTKPEVRVVTHKTPEIGFSVFGPIFNIRLAFSVKNHDLVVSGLRVRLKHESGEEKLFEWQTIRQEVLKMTAPDASVTPFEKEQTVLAIKLNQKDIEERFVQFQEVSFQKRKIELESAAVKKRSHLRQTGSLDLKSAMENEESTELITFVKQSFSWKSGRYEVTFEMDSPEKFILLDNIYEFFLNTTDIEKLEKNKDNIKAFYNNELKYILGVEIDEIVWNWGYPILRKVPA